MNFEYTVETVKDVATAIESLEQELTGRKFSVLWHLNVNEKLREKGQDLAPEFHILEVCSAPRAKQALETNIRVGYFLPCKIVVYRQDGRTRIGLLRPGLLMDLLNDERLRDLATEVEETLIAVVDSVK